jgi:hypothetical protein
VLLHGVAVDVESTADPSEVAATLRSATAAGPFEVETVERIGHDVHRCTFRVRRPGLVVRYRNVIDLQHRLDRVVHILAVAPRRSLEPVAIAG